MTERLFPSSCEPPPDTGEEGFRTALLTPAYAPRTYPLVRICDPALTFDEWAAVCDGASMTSGALLVLCGRGYVRALGRFAAEHVSSYGYTLTVHDLVTGHPLDPTRFASLLLRRLETHARNIGCSTLLVTVPDGVAWLERLLLSERHARLDERFVKFLPAGTGAGTYRTSPARPD